MTWQTERVRAGRRRFRVVEVVLDFCSLTYSIAPCVAVLGTTGDHKCYNTRVSCQDPANYTPVDKTYRFCEPVTGIPRSSSAGTPFDAIPSLRKVDIAPTRIDPGRTIGKRASVRLEFQDHPHHDREIDNYVAERISGVAAADGSTFEPFDQGTFFGKLRARNPFYIGRLVHIYTGYLPWDHDLPPDQQPAVDLPDTLASMRKQTYVMDRWTGPDGSGKFGIEAKDLLKLASDERAEAPVQNSGRLLGDINNSVTTAFLTPAGIGNSEYAASGTIRIGSEIMTFTRAADTLTITRETDGTTADSHSDGDAVQECLRYTATRVDAIIQDLLENFANISSGFIPIADWQAEAVVWNSAHVYNTLLIEPTGVTTLVNELCAQSLVYIWWDEIDQEIKYRALRPQDSEATVTEDNAILEDAFVRRDQPSQRLTRVMVYFDRASPLDRLDDPASFKQTFLQVATDAETSDEYGETRILRIFSRWFDANNRGQALQLASRMLASYRDDPITYEFRMGAKDADLWTASVFTIQHRLVQGLRGEQESRKVQVLEVQENEDGIFQYRAINDLFLQRYGFIGPDGLADFGSATDVEKDTYAWIAQNTGDFADGTDAYRII